MRMRASTSSTSLYGAMFAPRPELVAAELLRVCRRGGTIAMGNWTKEGFIGKMFRTFARFIAPPGMPSPVLWGDEGVVRERFGSALCSAKLTRVNYRFDYPFAPAEVVEFFRETTAPRHARSPSSARPSRRTCARDLVELWSTHNVAPTNDRTVVDGEYLTVVGIRA